MKLGWVAPSLSSCPNIYVPQVETNPVVYKFVTSNPNEYFLIENRQKYGFDQYLPGDGLAIYHIDDNITTQNDMEWYPGCATCTSHYQVAIEQADGLWELEKSLNAGNAGDLFKSGWNPTFNNTSTPDSKDYAGNQTNVSITNIGIPGETMTASINVQESPGGGIPIAVAPYMQCWPAVASDGTNSLVVWDEYDDITGIYKIYGTFVNQSGGIAGACRFFIADGAGASVAFDGTNYLVVYTDYTNDVYGDIYGARVSTAGGVLNRFVISASSPSYPDSESESAPQIAFNGTVYFVVWNKQQFIGQDKFDVFGARVNPNGVVLDPQGIDIFPSIDGGEFYPDVASDGANFLVVAGDFTFITRQVYGARVDSSGTLLDPDGIVVSSTGINDPSIAFDGTSYLVVWTDIRNDPQSVDIYGSRVTRTGSVLDPSGIAISTNGINDVPSVTFAQGIYLVTWRSSIIPPSNNNNDMYGTRITPSAVILDILGIPISKAINEQEFPDITFDGSNFLVVWADGRNGGDNGNQDIYGARVSPDGVVLDP